MKNENSKTTFNCRAMAITLCLTGASSPLLAEEDSSDNIREFLSDPQRVGSLTGIILGGALTAHPVGAAAGSVIGFFMGKQTMFEAPEKLDAGQKTFAQRSIIPQNPQHQVLALSNSGTSYTLQQITPDEQTGTMEMQTNALTSLQQITTYCYGDDHQQTSIDSRLQAMCYYHLSSG